MVRKIIIPTERTFTLEIPESFIGKKIELLAFEVEQTENDNEQAVKRSFAERTENLRYQSKGYKFNRMEANEYDR
ncbi:MAG: hypothetical protein WD431_21695 [Cyclobacteriaceae bacterium]